MERTITYTKDKIIIEKGLKTIENELVPVYETNTGEKVVYGSELYSCLGSKRQYTDWIKSRLSECDAEENADYQSFSQNNEKPNGGRPKTEYIIKLDVAKEMAMLERNEKGKKVRRYFIEVEKKYKNESSPKLPTTYLEALKELVAKEEENQRLLADNERMKPKEEFFDAVSGSKDAIEIGKVAKVLNYPGIGRNKLFEILRNKGVLMRDNIPYQKYIDNGCFRTVEQKFSMPDGETRINIKTLVYQKGVDYIRRILEVA